MGWIMTAVPSDRIHWVVFIRLCASGRTHKAKGDLKNSTGAFSLPGSDLNLCKGRILSANRDFVSYHLKETGSSDMTMITKKSLDGVAG